MIEIIGWILIGIFVFYIIRNIYAGSVLYPLAEFMSNKVKQEFTGYPFKGKCPYNLKVRNYYLFVLNPFWWTLTSVFKDAVWRDAMRNLIKNLRKMN